MLCFWKILNYMIQIFQFAGINDDVKVVRNHQMSIYLYSKGSAIFNLNFNQTSIHARQGFKLFDKIRFTLVFKCILSRTFYDLASPTSL